MDAKQSLERYLMSHPDYWEFEDEKLEVSRLTLLTQKEKSSAGLPFEKNSATLHFKRQSCLAY